MRLKRVEQLEGFEHTRTAIDSISTVLLVGLYSYDFLKELVAVVEPAIAELDINEYSKRNEAWAMVQEVKRFLKDGVSYGQENPLT
jgi:hypothetical protein